MACEGNSGDHRLTPGAVSLTTTMHGGPPPGSTVAEWIAKADQESDYRDRCLHTGGSAVGLWGVLSSHAGRIPGSPSTDAQMRIWLQNPGNNWKAAKFLYEQAGNSWQPWAASGGKPTPNATHRQAATDADESLGSGLGIGDIAQLGVDAVANPIDSVQAAIEFLADAILEPFKAIVEFLNRIGEWISDRHNWTRIAMIGGGLALGSAAFSITVSSSKPVKDLESKVTGVATTVATKGKNVAANVASSKESSNGQRTGTSAT